VTTTGGTPRSSRDAPWPASVSRTRSRSHRTARQAWRWRHRHAPAPRHGQADTHVNLGHTLAALDRPESAREAWRQALVILEDLGHPDAERVRASLHQLDPLASNVSEDGGTVA
jgi:hypothetical protein